MTLVEIAVPVALALVVAGAVIVGSRRRVRQLGALVRDAQGRQAALDEISEVWQWQTDATHRLTALRPPACRIPPGDSGDASAPFWERFLADGSARLATGMKSAAALDDLELEADPWQEAKRTFRLRGRPLCDSRGAFAGYVGTLREIVAAPELHAAPAVASPVPIAVPTAVAGAPGGAAATQVVAASGEADHEALGTLVSHDLRAPIRVVEGFTRIVKEDYAHVLDDIGRDHLDRVLGAAGRMNHMIDALLALSKLAAQPICRVPVDLSQLGAYIVEDLRRLRPEHEVAVTIEPGMTASGDPTQLRMVLENLLGNAWKYTGNTARAEIAFERDPGQASGFVVRDNGAGFDMRYVDRLFGVFQRLHSASEFPGTGVGLASVRRIVRRHGGDIRAEGEPDHGARFHFSLPPHPVDG